MIIAVDETIPYAKEAFGRIGEVSTFAGSRLNPIDLVDADALVVRSITPVHAGLLEGTRITFVGTATIGMDHVDLEYLAAHGIHFSNAAGCNAEAVAEYWVVALLSVAERKDWDLRRKSVGIVGAGHIGSRVEQKARALGMDVSLCDPPLRERTGDFRYGFLPDVLDADILTFHVPLTSDGAYPTRHMLSGSVIERLRQDQFLVNTARGAVFSSPDVKRALERKRIAGAVLDVWEGEPQIDLGLLDLVDLGTAHIAGFSLDGKIRATAMILDGLCRFHGLENTWDAGALYPPSRTIRPTPGTTGYAALRSIVSQAYAIADDDAKLRAATGRRPAEAAAAFSSLRDGYRFRPEFHHFVVELPDECGELSDCLLQLGFQVQTGNSSRQL